MKGEKKEKKKYKQEGEETEENEREIKTSISKKMTTLKKQVNFAWEPTLVKTELVSTHEYDEDYIQMYPLCKGTQVQSWRRWQKTMQVLQLAPSRGGHGCCTELTDFKQEGINHVEGGWPKDIDVKEQDQVRISRIKLLAIMTDLCVADGEVHQEDREGREVHQQLPGDRAGGGAQGQAEQLRGHLQGLLPIHRRGGHTRAGNEKFHNPSPGDVRALS